MNRWFSLPLAVLFCGNVFAGDLPQPTPSLQILENFESDCAKWTPWADPNSLKPQIKLIAEAACGRQAAELTFPYTTHTTLIAYPVRLPEKTAALSFWCKQSSGSGGISLRLAENPGKCPEGEGADIFAASVPLTAQWQKVVLPLSAFAYSYSQKGPGNHQLELAKVGELFFASGENATSFSFCLDELVVETSVAAAVSAPPPPPSRST